ncbi:MAG: hypothetical protein EBR82_41870 [Caulobacteraceae bacterium]|nr:hypothetical protein [Caulobacteraceae bacterium]
MDWTLQDSREWTKVWAMPHMQKGLKLIARRVRPKKSANPVAQGFDLSPVFIKSAGFYEGAQEVMDLIETLSNSQIENKPKFDLPEPFSHITSEDKNQP